jgi:hypothetical protein
MLDGSPHSNCACVRQQAMICLWLGGSSLDEHIDRRGTYHTEKIRFNFFSLSIPRTCDSRGPVTRVIWGHESHEFVWPTNLCDLGHNITQIFTEGKSHRFSSICHPDFQRSKFCVIFVMRSHKFCRSKNRIDYH